MSSQVARPLRIALAALGAAGFLAGLAVLYSTMRDVLRTTGGFCASGGPYVVAHACPAGAAGHMVLSILAILIAGAVFAGACSWSGGSSVVACLVMWTVLFGVLGVCFLTTRHGSTVTGVVFEAMALMGLLGVGSVTLDLMRGEDRPAVTTPAIVRAAVGPAPRS